MEEGLSESREEEENRTSLKEALSDCGLKHEVTKHGIICGCWVTICSFSTSG